MSNIQRGLYADGELGSPFSLLRRTKRWIFHLFGKVPVFRQLLYAFKGNCALDRATAFTTSAGVSSGPCAFLFCRELAAFQSSVSVKGRGSSATISASSSLRWCVGKSPFTFFSTVFAFLGTAVAAVLSLRVTTL